LCWIPYAVGGVFKKGTISTSLHTLKSDDGSLADLPIATAARGVPIVEWYAQKPHVPASWSPGIYFGQTTNELIVVVVVFPKLLGFPAPPYWCTTTYYFVFFDDLTLVIHVLTSESD